jgi:2-(1,2-epoxy-1,2-dihydrophenyl)acetyl-CoA isomerase
MSEPLVLVARQGAVCQLTLNRPQSLNAFTAAMHGELMAALDQAAGDTSVRCVVLTGAGRGFCAGQDLADPAMAPDPKHPQTPRDIGALIEAHYKPLALRLRSMPVPVLAAVNGVAAGAGANAALNCDVVVAARSASFIQAFARIGLIPDCGGTWLLPRLVGRARALGLSLLGDKLSAEDAARMGLIWQCVDDVALTASVQALAERLAQMPIKALVATRKALDEAMLLPYGAALDAEAKLQREMGYGADHREGTAAFLQKRPPVFRDR